MTMDVGKLLTETGFGGDPEALLLQPLSEGGDQRRGAGLPGREPLPRRRASDICLDPVELGDPAQALGGDLGAVAVEHFLQFPPCVRPAMCHADRTAALAGRARQAVVALVAVELQDPVEATQEFLRVLSAAVGRIEEDHARRIVSTPGPVVAGQCPEISGLRLAAPWIQHRRRGLVHEQLGRHLQMLGQPLDHGGEVERGSADPVGQRAAMDIDARPGKDLALTMQGQMVRVLGNQNMRNGAFRRQTAFDEMRRCRHLRDAVGTGAAGVFGADGDDHAQLCGHDVQPLRAILADFVHLTTAARAMQTGGFDHTLDARKVLRQVAPIATGRTAGFALGRALRVLALFDLGDGCLEIFESQLPFIFAELFRPFAVNRVVQLGNQVLQTSVDLLERIPFTQHCGDSITLVGGDRGKVDGHGGRHGRRIARDRSECLSFPVPDSFCRSRRTCLQCLHLAPVQAREQRLELGMVQRHRTIPYGGPGEGRIFQAFVSHDQAGAVKIQEFQTVGAPGPEHKNRAGERVLAQH